MPSLDSRAPGGAHRAAAGPDDTEPRSTGSPEPSLPTGRSAAC